MNREAALREEVAILRERIIQLEEIIGMTVESPVEWGLTYSENKIFGCLVARDLVTSDHIMAALYRGAGRDQPGTKTVDVFLCSLRKKLAANGATITNWVGMGWRLDSATRSRFKRERTANVEPLLIRSPPGGSQLPALAR